MKIIFKNNLERDTLNNKYFRRVLNTTDTQQLVLMHLHPGQEIGTEKHEHTTQFIRIESGKATAIVNNIKYILKSGDCIIIPSNTIHNIIAGKKEACKLYTIYSPPEHSKGLKILTKLI